MKHLFSVYKEKVNLLPKYEYIYISSGKIQGDQLRIVQEMPGAHRKPATGSTTPNTLPNKLKLYHIYFYKIKYFSMQLYSSPVGNIFQRGDMLLKYKEQKFKLKHAGVELACPLLVVFTNTVCCGQQTFSCARTKCAVVIARKCTCSVAIKNRKCARVRRTCEIYYAIQRISHYICYVVIANCTFILKTLVALRRRIIILIVVTINYIMASSSEMNTVRE